MEEKNYFSPFSVVCCRHHKDFPPTLSSSKDLQCLFGSFYDFLCCSSLALFHFSYFMIHLTAKGNNNVKLLPLRSFSVSRLSLSLLDGGANVERSFVLVVPSLFCLLKTIIEEESVLED